MSVFVEGGRLCHGTMAQWPVQAWSEAPQQKRQYTWVEKNLWGKFPSFDRNHRLSVKRCEIGPCNYYGSLYRKSQVAHLSVSVPVT